MKKKPINNDIDHPESNMGLGNIQQLLNDTCQVHKGSRFDYLCVDSSQNFLFKCMYCVTDDNINQLSLIPIEQILAADSKTIFANFPLKDRDLTKEIKSILENPPTGTFILQQIENFFKEFRAKFIDRLNSIQQKMTKQAQSISDFGPVLVSNYNRICSKEMLKSIISDQQKPIETKSSELKEICAETLSKDEENKQLFTQLIDSIKTLEKATDFQTPKLISEQLIKKLDSINMFLVDNIGRFQSQQSRPNTQEQQLEQEEEPNRNSIQNLMKLVRNNLNDVSAGSCSQLEESLNRFSVVIDQMPVPAPGPLYDSFHQLDQDENTIFTTLISEVAHLRKLRLEREEQQSRMQNNDQYNLQTEYLNANQIIELVRNSTNFCSNEFIEDFSKVMTTVGGLIGLFRVRKSNHNSSEERRAFNSLNTQQLNEFAQLAAQVNTLTRNHADRYLLSRFPQQLTQSNSLYLKKIISDHALLKVCTQEERTNIEKNLYQLLVKYPIAELLPPFKLFKRLPINFSRTKYSRSCQIGITLNENELELSFPNCADKFGQVVSEKLKNESGYLLRLKFNRPYGKLLMGQFKIGLIPNSQIDSHCVLTSSNESGFGSALKYGATKVCRGGRLSSEGIRSVTSGLEFRWCVSKRQFFISDLNYTNINQVVEKHFNPNEIYHFGIYFQHIHENDMKVNILDFQEIDPELVNIIQ